MNGFDWTRYAVGGAAARPDSFTKLNQDYAARVAQMLQAADVELGPQALKITSAYRSPEVQARLYQQALAKYGSPQAARKWVAPPGRSKHNAGLAVDFANAQGSLLRDAKSREAQWIAQNAARFGLSVPMSWEPWQVELAGARGGQTPRVGFGPNVPAAPQTNQGLAAMFAADPSALSMGTPVDPFAGQTAQRAAAEERRRDEEEATQRRRAALLSGVGAMFG